MSDPLPSGAEREAAGKRMAGAAPAALVVNRLSALRFVLAFGA